MFGIIKMIKTFINTFYDNKTEENIHRFFNIKFSSLKFKHFLLNYGFKIFMLPVLVFMMDILKYDFLQIIY